MKRFPKWAIVVACALIGVAAGGLVGAFIPISPRYEAEASVAFVPAPNLSVADSSGYWEALSRGQVSRTAAIVYGDHRWLASAAKSAAVPQTELTLKAGAVADTTAVRITMQADSAAAAESALRDVLARARHDVGSVSAPFDIQEISPPEGSANDIAPKSVQVVTITTVGGLLIGLGVGWLIKRPKTHREAETTPADEPKLRSVSG